MFERIHLSVVEQVDKQGSLTVAAGVLYLAQSALSHSMRKLKLQLGTEIWLRLTQAVQYRLAVPGKC